MTRLIMVCLLCLTIVTANSQQLRSLDIYWIDVEGGAATFIVTPRGESVLIDAGWPNDEERDVKRIIKAINDAGIAKIDYFIATHFHEDHVGGLPALAKRIPIGQCIDYGISAQQDNAKIRKTLEGYLSVAKGRRRTVIPGDTLPLDGIDFTFVSANRAVLDHSLSDTTPNSLCEKESSNDHPEHVNKENECCLGYLLSLGEFDFIDLGDLTINIQLQLACPSNLIGSIDLYQVPHHGNGLSPQLTWALAPTVAIVNNGPRKGGGPEGFKVIKAIPGLKAIWQIHRALMTDDEHNTSERLTANLTEENDAGHWIKATVQTNGESYIIENARNAYKKTYQTK